MAPPHPNPLPSGEREGEGKEEICIELAQKVVKIRKG